MSDDLKPFISADENDQTVIECWNGIRKITVYPASNYLLKSWGSNMETEMEEVDLLDPTRVKAAFDWLLDQVQQGAGQ